MNKMKPFSKLFASIVTSSIWTEDAETRVVWVTMLAICDADGDVWASVGGLAKAAGVSRDVCAVALAKFLAPDHDSRTKEHEGRRIEEIDGGWRLLNYRKYRELGRTEDRRQYFAAKKRESRAAMSTNVHKCPQQSTMSPIAEAEAEAEANTKAAATPPPYTPADCKDQPMEDVSASMFMERTWMDWKLEIGRHRVYIDREGNSEAHWAALYGKSGWDEFTKAWNYCAGKSKGKVFLSNMLEVLK